MNESLQNIGDLIAEPSSTFTRLRSNPRWGLACLIFLLLAAFMGWVLMPYTSALMDAQIDPNEMTQEQLEATRQVMAVLKYIPMILGPISAFLVTLIISALLRLVVRFTLKESELRFRHILAAMFHVALPSWIVQLVNTALILIFKDVGDVKSAIDLKMIPGLHHLYAAVAEGSLNPKVAIFLSHFNPLSLWIIAILVIAVARLTDIEKPRARVIAILLWLLGVLVEALPAS